MPQSTVGEMGDMGSLCFLRTTSGSLGTSEPVDVELTASFLSLASFGSSE